MSAAGTPGGREVFAILARENADMLAVYLRSLVSSEDAVDDLFQETLLTAWRRLDDYDRARPFGPWLRGIASRLVLRHRERAGRDLLRCDTAVLAELEQHFSSAAGDTEELQHTLERLAECVARLPERLRDVVRLVYEQGLALRAAAARLGAGEEAVKKRLQRGRAQLAECLRGGARVARRWAGNAEGAR